MAKAPNTVTIKNVVIADMIRVLTQMSNITDVTHIDLICNETKSTIQILPIINKTAQTDPKPTDKGLNFNDLSA